MNNESTDIFKDTLDSVKTSIKQSGLIAKLLPLENNNRIFAAYKLPEKQISLIAEVPTKFVKFEKQFESKGFSVTNKKKDTNNDVTQVIISLIDNNYKDVFFEITELFIKKIKNIKDDRDFYNILIERIEIYSNFFDKHSKQGLLINAQQGLYAELDIMENFFIKYFNIPLTLEMWQAPQSGLHDFTYKGVSMEVKSTHKFPAQDVSISSEFQLNDKRVSNLYLAVLEVKRGSIGGESIREKIEKIRELIASQNSELNTKFNDLLNKYGYYDAHSHNYYVSFKTNLVHYYKVVENFPRILPDRILDGVKSIRYKIDLNKCVNFITEGSSIKQNFKDVV
ncbi:MAG: hypothetical protein CFH22_00955 [Alphaproteobacteria bacterium MarineAlpha5_Bin12]|nr:MAG: hypothetical protein CFH22_00955 [Alphaproteobacteria bacterium MarineAlpha5_Bin12]|tara:strand:- start:7594 stop:8607 length:1014 start_codon:yes stop_codon:yes gene_type:complete